MKILVSYETRKPKESIGTNNVILAYWLNNAPNLHEIVVRKIWPFSKGPLTFDLKICEWKWVLWVPTRDGTVQVKKSEPFRSLVTVRGVYVLFGSFEIRYESDCVFFSCRVRLLFIVTLEIKAYGRRLGHGWTWVLWYVV